MIRFSKIYILLFLLASPQSIAKIATDDGANVARKNIKQQCADYRAIYDPLFHKLKEEDPTATQAVILKRMASIHSTELFKIFVRGATEVIEGLKTQQIKIDEWIKDYYNGLLGKITDLAVSLHRSQEFTTTNFIALNLLFARWVSEFKSEFREGALRSNISAAFDDMFRQFGSVQEDRRWDRPIFIVYAHPDATKENRGISMDTFLDEYVGDGLYPGWMALFDVHSNVREKPTKKDRHFSYENGTYYWLRHDLTHIPGVRHEERGNLFGRTIQGHKIAKKMADRNVSQNDIMIVRRSLFFLFHDQIKFADLGSDDPIEQLKLASSRFLVKFLGLNKFNIRDDEYKEEVRDYEHVLKLKDEFGIPFLPAISISENKSRVLPIAKRGQDYFVIEHEKDFTDDMTWVEKNADAPRLAQTARRTLLAPLITESFTRFWERFRVLLDSHGK